MTAIERVNQIKEDLRMTAHPQIGGDGMQTGLYKKVWERIKREVPKPYYCGICMEFSEERHDVNVDLSGESAVVTCNTAGRVYGPVAQPD